MLALKILRHLLLDAALFTLLWFFLIHGRRRLRQWPILTQYRYAHRGLHGPGAPENSLAAFRLAAGAGYGAELDVHLTRDGRLAVLHDSSLCRVCGADGIVEELTSAELNGFRLCGTEEKIPFLEEVLPIFAGRAPLLIEIKPRHNAAVLTETVCRLLDGYRGDFCVESFHPGVLFWLRRHRPDVIRGQLARNFLRDRARLDPVSAFLLTNLCLNFLSKPDFIAYRFSDRRVLSLCLCRKLFGLREFSWTITSPAQQHEAERDAATVIFEGYLPET